MITLTHIQEKLSPVDNQQIQTWFLFKTLPSTNQFLLDAPLKDGYSVCLAEQQTAGRGRQGRTWEASTVGNIYCSLAYVGKNFEPGLSIVVGICLAEVLSKHGVFLQLKWPNDLWCEEKKLGGILIEVRGNKTIIGFGINLQAPLEAQNIGQAWTCLAQHLSPLPTLESLLSDCLSSLLHEIPRFQAEGLAPFLPRFEARDALLAKPVQLETTEGFEKGIAAGLTSTGQLRVQCATGIKTFDHSIVHCRVVASS